MASLCVGKATLVSTFSPPISLWPTKEPEMPMRSQLPLAKTSWVSTLSSWYLSEELPALMTRTFMWLSSK